MEHQKTTEATGYLIGNKFADKITKNLQQSYSETIINEHDKEIPQERYISRGKAENYLWSDINIIV